MKVVMPAMLGTKKCQIITINVKKGQYVVKGSDLLHIEGKKGSHVVKAPVSGTINEILVSEGEEAAAGELLLELSETSTAESEVKETGKESEDENEVSSRSTLDCDLLIIGGGSGGYVAAIYAAKKGKKVILVEKNMLGGTCLNFGCIPTKTMVASAHHYQDMLQADKFGIMLSDKPYADLAKMVDRKNRVVNQLVSGISYLMQKNEIQVIKGEASFVSPNTVMIRNQEDYTQVHFANCIIATGSVSSRPPIPGIDLEGVIDSTGALSMTELPESLTIVGGGVIGLEFAFIYRNLGVKVTVVEALDRLLTMVDTDLSESILEYARDRGIRIELSANVKSFRKGMDGEIITEFEQNHGSCLLVSDKVLVAVGRRAYMEGLQLDHAGVELDERKRNIKVNRYMETSVPHIYAVGDVNGLVQLAHAASYEAEIAVKHMFGEQEAFQPERIPSVIFTDPEIATVGLNEDVLRARHIPYKKGVFHFSANGKALSEDRASGYIKLLMDENEKILGAGIIGPDASTLIASVGICIANGSTVKAILNTVFAHPTTAEVIHEAALDLTIGAFHE
jgi:dihydrolipoamide dehydrogenase